VCSPFRITIEPGVVEPRRCKAHGKALVAACVGQPTSFALEANDAFGNSTVTPLQSIYAVLYMDGAPRSRVLIVACTHTNCIAHVPRRAVIRAEEPSAMARRPAEQEGRRSFEQLLPSASDKQMPSALSGIDANQALQALADQWWKQHRTFANLISSLDADHNNTISPHELERALAQLGLSISPEQLRRVVSTFDQNYDGRISRDEVVREVLKRKPRADQAATNAASGAGVPAPSIHIAPGLVETPSAAGGTTAKGVTAAGGTTAPVRFADAGRNCFVGEYTSFARGPAALAVSINGTPIMGSPFR
jgi:hypothetical protein